MRILGQLSGFNQIQQSSGHRLQWLCDTKKLYCNSCHMKLQFIWSSHTHFHLTEHSRYFLSSKYFPLASCPDVGWMSYTLYNSEGFTDVLILVILIGTVNELKVMMTIFRTKHHKLGEWRSTSVSQNIAIACTIFNVLLISKPYR